MRIEEAIQILKDNAKAENDSFLNCIHERREFDKEKFWGLYNAIRLAGHMTAQEEKLSRELTEHIVKTYTWLLQCISYHFDNADEYKLKELPKDFNQYLGRIRLAVDAYVTGNTINDELEAYENGELSNQIPIRIKE